MRRDHEPVGRPVPPEIGERPELVDADVGVVDEHVPAFHGGFDPRHQQDVAVARVGGQLVVVGEHVVVGDPEHAEPFTGRPVDHLTRAVLDRRLGLLGVDVQVGLQPRCPHHEPPPARSRRGAALTSETPSAG